jgi:hypothetical protein
VKGKDDIVDLSLQGAEGVKKFIEMEIHIGQSPRNQNTLL